MKDEHAFRLLFIRQRNFFTIIKVEGICRWVIHLYTVDVICPCNGRKYQGKEDNTRHSIFSFFQNVCQKLSFSGH